MTAMTHKERLKKAKRYFWGMTIFFILFVALFESNLVAHGFITLSPTARYIADVAGILLTIGLIPLALKGFSRGVKKALNAEGNNLARQYSRLCIMRMSIIYTVIIINAILYYGTENSGAFYCCLFGIASFIYSYPAGNTPKNNQNPNE